MSHFEDNGGHRVLRLETTENREPRVPSLYADTGFWVALRDKKDTYHHQAVTALQQYDEPLITPRCVITESICGRQVFWWE